MILTVLQQQWEEVHNSLGPNFTNKQDNNSYHPNLVLIYISYLNLDSKQKETNTNHTNFKNQCSLVDNDFVELQKELNFKNPEILNALNQEVVSFVAPCIFPSNLYFVCHTSSHCFKFKIKRKTKSQVPPAISFIVSISINKLNIN